MIEAFLRGTIVGSLGVLPWVSLFAGWGIAATAALTLPAVIAAWFLSPSLEPPPRLQTQTVEIPTGAKALVIRTWGPGGSGGGP